MDVRRRAEEELTRSQEQLRNLSRHLQTVREEERKGVAREIHDELGQNLTILKLHLSLLTEELPPESATLRGICRGIIDDIDATIQTVKRLISSLRPGLLDEDTPEPPQWLQERAATARATSSLPTPVSPSMSTLEGRLFAKPAIGCVTARRP